MTQSDTLDMDWDSVRGRFMRSADTIPANCEIMQTRCFAWSVLESFRKRVCAWCLKWKADGVSHGIKCGGCAQVYCCSRQCFRNLQHASLGNHCSICAAMKRLACFHVDKHCKSVLGLLLHIHARRQAERTRQDNLVWVRNFVHCHVLTPAMALTEKYATDSDSICQGEISTTNYTEFNMVMQLQSHLGDWDPQDRGDWRKCEKFMLSLLNLTDTPWDTSTTSCSAIMNMVSMVESNGFGIYCGPKAKLVGRALFPAASFFNHSCDSNCEAIRCGQNLVVMTKRPVLTGEELSISYIDTRVPLSNRRARLLSDYHFHCQCTRCRSEEKETKRKGRRIG